MFENDSVERGTYHFEGTLFQNIKQAVPEYYSTFNGVRRWFNGRDGPWFKANPIKGLHSHPEIQKELTPEQKETFEILDTRLIGIWNLVNDS